MEFRRPGTYHPEMDDHELVGRLRSGDEGAFAALVRQHHVSLLRMAESVVGNHAVAEEVVQDTWLAVCRGVGSFEERSSLRTWLYRILINRARTAAARERRSQPVPGDRIDACSDREGLWFTPATPWWDRVEDQVVAHQLTDEIARALPALPDAQRRVLLMRDVEGIAPIDVCTVLHITAGNQRVLLHRARGRLRASLADSLPV